MATERITDRQGCVIGRIENHNSGRLRGVDFLGNLIAYYDPSLNRTILPNGQVHCSGNDLASLIREARMNRK